MTVGQGGQRNRNGKTTAVFFAIFSTSEEEEDTPHIEHMTQYEGVGWIL